MTGVTSTTPKVSIGVPVFNGENYLREALESVLSQTFSNLQVIICDNASTDSTQAICEEFAGRDSRVAYVRNDSNIGVDLNFNRVLDLATAEYFKWVAHDDLLEPSYIEKCVQILDAHPDVVLCHSLTNVIDEEGRSLAIYDSGLRSARSIRQSTRFAALVLHQHICSEIFGLMRTDVARRSQRLEGNYHGSDRAMLAELSLLGRFAQIEEPLFLNREHSARAVRAVKPQERFAQRQLNVEPSIGMNTLHVYRDYWRAVFAHASSPANKARCVGHLFAWWFVSWNALRVGTELIAQVFPGFYDLAKRAKYRITRPAHPLVDTPTDTSR